MSKGWTIFAVALSAGAGHAESGTNAFAQVAQSVATHDMTFREIFAKGGNLMFVLAALSVVGLALVIYLLAILRREQVVPSRFVVGLQTQLREGRIVEARSACHANGSPIAAVMEAALDYVTRAEGRPDNALLREVVEGEGSRQATQFQNLTQYLNDIAVIAPMIGLLGTVWGMLQAFNVVALDMARAKPLELAGGVSLSLITTCGGLFVAIPAMAAYFYFRNRASKLTSELEVVSSRLLVELERR